MNKLSPLFVAVIALFMASAAVAGPFDGTHDEDTAKRLSADGIAFSQTLYAGYMDLSKDRDNFFGTDRLDAELFNHKALHAARRSSVQNDSVYDRDLTSEERTPFFIGQERLYMVFDKGGRELAPVETGTAQVAYDCWIEATEAGRDGDADECRQRFEDAITAAEAKAGYEIAVIQVAAPKVAAPAPKAAPIPPQEYYIIPFEFDSTVMTAEGEAQLAQAINDVGSIEELKISLRAHADRAGAEDYNVKLSQRRAEAVLNRLAGAGISQERLRIVEAVGESRSLIPTADGVRNQGNRVVEVDLRQ